MAEIIKTPEVQPVGNVVDTFVRPVAQPSPPSQLVQFVNALAPIIKVAEDKALTAKRKRDAEIASEETKNKTHQLDLAYVKISNEISQDFEKNGETYLTENTHEEVTDKYNRFWKGYAQTLTDDNVDPVLVKGFERKMELDMAGIQIKLADARRAKNLEQQDTELLGVLRILSKANTEQSAEDIKSKLQQHVEATGGNFARIEALAVNEALLLSKVGLAQPLIEALSTFGRDGTNVLNKPAYQKAYGSILANQVSAGKRTLEASKGDEASKAMANFWNNYANPDDGVKNSAKLQIGKPVTIDLGAGVSHTFTPTFDDYRPLIEQEFTTDMVTIETLGVGEPAKERLRDEAERKRFEVYLDHGKIPADIEQARIDGIGYFNQGNLEDPLVVGAARRAYDKIDQIFAYSNGQFLPNVLKNSEDRHRFLAVRRMVRNQKDFKTALGIVQGYVRFEDDIVYTVKEVQDVIDKGIFDLTNLDETTNVRSNLVMAKEVGEYATMLFNTGAVESREEALLEATMAVREQFVVVNSALGQQSSALRLQKGNADITATVDSMEGFLQELREDPKASSIIAGMFVGDDVAPFSVKRSAGLGVGGFGALTGQIAKMTGIMPESFDLIFEPSGNPNVAHVYAIREDNPSLMNGVLLGNFDLTKSSFEEAENFAEQLRKDLNSTLEDEGEDWAEKLYDQTIGKFLPNLPSTSLSDEEVEEAIDSFLGSSSASALTSEIALPNLLTSLRETADEAGYELQRTIAEAVQRAADTGEGVKDTVVNVIRSYFGDEEDTQTQEGLTQEGIFNVGSEITNNQQLVQNTQAMFNGSNLKQALDIAVVRGKASSSTTDRIVNEILLPIAFHESARTMDPTIKQRDGGPARGLLQMEPPRAVDAVKRMVRILKSEGKPIPEWATEMAAQADQVQKEMEPVYKIHKNLSKGEKLTPEQYNILYGNPLYDVSRLTADQQLALGLYDMLGYKGDIQEVLDGNMSVETFWVNYWHQGKDAKAAAAFASNQRQLNKLMR